MAHVHDASDRILTESVKVSVLQKIPEISELGVMLAAVLNASDPSRNSCLPMSQECGLDVGRYRSSHSG